MEPDELINFEVSSLRTYTGIHDVVQHHNGAEWGRHGHTAMAVQKQLALMTERYERVCYAVHQCRPEWAWETSVN